MPSYVYGTPNAGQPEDGEDPPPPYTSYANSLRSEEEEEEEENITYPTLLSQPRREPRPQPSRPSPARRVYARETTWLLVGTVRATPTGPERRSKKPGCAKWAVFAGLLLIGLVLVAGTVLLLERTRPIAYERHVAIIGAGPAGLSAAYHANKLARERRIPHKITVFEKEARVGGIASGREPVYGPDGERIEVGESTFPSTAQTLVRLANDLGLSTHAVPDGNACVVGRGDGSFGVYDGSGFVYREPEPGNFLSRAWWSFKLFFFYGWSPRRAQALLSASQSARARLYSSQHLPFTSLDELVSATGLDQEASFAAADFLSRAKVAGNFQRDVFNAWVRANAAQNLGTISALGAFASMDGSRKLAVGGEAGIRGLWERTADASGARLRLATTVVGLRKGEWGGWVLAARSTDGKELFEAFDDVVVAAPWEMADLEIKHDALRHTPENASYVHAHTALFASAHKLAVGGPPDLVLTTPGKKEYGAVSRSTGVAGVGQAGYWSAALLKETAEVDESSGEVRRKYLYKVESAHELSDEALEGLVGCANGCIHWAHRYSSPFAHAYLYPRRGFGNVQLDEHIWYTGGIDELLSGIEMGAFMGANVARLVVDRWKQEGPHPPENRRIPSEEPPRLKNALENCVNEADELV